VKWVSNLILSEDNVKAMLREHILANAKQFHLDNTRDLITNVDIKIGKRCEGYGMGEHDVTYFDNVTITVERNEG
jgi:adenine-specific DNA methylase